METRRDVFQAIADPTRRQIIGLLAKKPQNLNTIAGHFDVSRQAVSLHIRILSECGLVRITRSGRERYCQAQLQKLREVADWTEQYRNFWTARLDALGSLLEQENTEPDKPFKKTKK